MKRRELISPLFFLLLALFTIEQASKLPVGSWRSPAPGFFPLLLGILLAILSAALLFSASVRGKELPAGAQLSTSSLGTRKVAWSCVALLGFNFLFETLGFLLVSFLFIAFLLLIVSRKNWGMALGAGLLSSLGLYVLFGMILRLPLPPGIFRF